MAISRYNRPAEQPIIDTYVPLPFREIKEAITNKQKDYDITEDIWSKAPKLLDNIQVHERWQDAYGRDLGENIDYADLKAKKEQLKAEQEFLYNSFNGDWSSPEAQRAIKNWASKVGSWYENTGKPMQAKTQAYLKEKEEASKKKNQLGYQDAYFNFNNYLRDQANMSAKGVRNYDWQSPIYNEYLDKSEAVNKAASNLGSIVKEWSNGRKTNLEDLTAEEYTKFRKNNIQQIESAKTSLLSQLNQKHQQEAYELARQLAPKGVSPEEYFNETVKIKVPSKDSKGNTITKEVPYKRGELLKNQLDQEVSSLFDAKLNIEKKDLVDYSNLSKDQLGALGIGENGLPLTIERSTQVGGEVTGMEPIDFSKVDDRNNKFNLPDNVPSMFGEYGIKPNDSRLEGHVLSHTSNPETYLKEINKGLNSPNVNSFVKEIYKKEKPKIEKLVKEREIVRNKLEAAKKGDLLAMHEVYYETNPVYKNTTYAYAKANDKLGKTLTKDDIKQIQAISNRNLQTIQANQELSLNELLDKEALYNITNSVINGNAIIRDDKGTIIPQEDFNEIQNEALPDKQKTTEGKRKLIESGLTTFITPVGRKEAGYKLTIDGKNYHITYPNSEAVPKFREFQKITENVYNPNSPSEVKLESVPEEVTNVVGEGIKKHLFGKDIKGVNYSTVRNDYNINDSYVKATITYEDNGDLKTQNFEIPIFPKTSNGRQVTNISKLSTQINPQTGGYQDMNTYTSQDAQSLKYLQAK